MEKNFLLIIINYKTAFKFKLNENENNAQHMKTMEINTEDIPGKKLLVNLKQSSCSNRKVALMTKHITCNAHL